MTVIVILAMIFALLALRLYSVLGKRTGHEQQMPAPADDRPAATIAAPRPAIDVRSEVGGIGDTMIAPEAQVGLRAIIAADRTFDVTRFLGGARAAYGMVLEAFWGGDKDSLRSLCDDEVYGAFSRAIDERATTGHVLDNRLVRIDSARVREARLDAGTAQIAVEFEADIAAVTRDADGLVVAGSLEDAIATRELWTFERDVNSRSADWTLVATDEI